MQRVHTHPHNQHTLPGLITTSHGTVLCIRLLLKNASTRRIHTLILMVSCLTYRIVDISAAAANAPAEGAPAPAPAPMSFAALPLLSPTDALAAALRGDNIPTSRQLTPSEVWLHSLV